MREPKMTYVLSCPYCAVKVVGHDEAKVWVRWVMTELVNHPESGAVPPHEMSWERIMMTEPTPEVECPHCGFPVAMHTATAGCKS